MANLIINMTKASACAARVDGILKIEPAQQDGIRAADKLRGAVEFRDVTVRYQGSGEPALEHISFQAAPGETIGIIGGTGSGTTGVIQLGPRGWEGAEAEETRWKRHRPGMW